MKITDLLKYYNNEEILNELLEQSKDREVAVMFSKGFYGQRPSILMYRQEILDLIRAGALSFHMSVERWKNPMSLNSSNTKKEMDDLRSGWDLIIDIDTKIIDYAKICAKLICHAFEYHGIANYGIKFSGGTGFHLAIPYESFPKIINGIETNRLYPEAAIKIADYLRDFLKDKLSEMILEYNSMEQIMQKTGKELNELLENGKFNPYSILEIDAAALSPRHLIRMPYSINEKKGLASIVIEKKDIEDFNPNKAKLIEKIKIMPFIRRDKSSPNEANELFMQSFDYHKIKEKTIDSDESIQPKREFKKSLEKIMPDKYPPCIKNILKGLEDGKKRALFILINYFKSANYSKDEILEIINEWNKKNAEPIKETYIKTQMAWNLKSSEYLIPNCGNSSYYEDLGICEKDDFCQLIKNPLNYHYKASYKKITPKKQKKE